MFHSVGIFIDKKSIPFFSANVQNESMIKAHVAPFVRYWKGIRQAESPEGGTLPSIRGPLVRLMRDSYIKYGECVGTDARGK